jgi:hypothetical protein
MDLKWAHICVRPIPTLSLVIVKNEIVARKTELSLSESQLCEEFSPSVPIFRRPAL